MKLEALDLLRCPNCAHLQLELSVVDRDFQEIRSGTLSCLNCDVKMTIKKGIADMLPGISREIELSNEGIKRALKDDPFPEEVILSLPDVQARGEKYLRWKNIAANFHYILRKLNLRGNELVLDVGAGFGWVSKEFARVGCRVVASDISEEVLLVSDLYLKHNLYFDRIRAEMDKLPFTNAIFDIVIINSALHHSTDLRKTVAELTRVLKNGGKLVIVNEPVGGLIPNPSFACETHSKYYQTDRLYSIFKYKSVCRENGLKTQIFFPPSADRKLRRQKNLKLNVEYDPTGFHAIIKYYFGKIIGFLWQIKPFRYFFIRYLFYPTMILIGLSLVMICTKNALKKSS